MGKIHWKPGTVVYPVPVVMVSCGNIEQQKNIVTVAWTGTINTVPPMTYISLRPSRYSYDIIKKSGEFVINLVSKNPVFCDRKKLLNGNGCVLATSGAGKSFSIKVIIEQVLLRYPQDEICILDPQRRI